MKNKKVMLTGVRPSGNLTLGNYLGAIKNFVEKQNDFKSYIFIRRYRSCKKENNECKN